MDGTIRFRFAERGDIPLILRFIKELADYEGMLDQVVATEELLTKWLFEKEKAEVLLVLVYRSDYPMSIGGTRGMVANCSFFRFLPLKQARFLPFSHRMEKQICPQ